MKSINICTALLLTLAAATLTSCGEDDELAIPMPQHMTAGYVMSALDGKGWKHVESHEIKSNGAPERQDYWHGLTGGGPVQYSFAGDSVTTYSYIDAYPISGYRKRKYTYNEQTNQLMTGGNEMFKIISVSADELRLIKYQAIKGDGTKIYVYSVYRAMNGSELAYLARSHPYDLDSLNDKYPVLPEQTMITAGDFKLKAVGNTWRCAEAHKIEMAGRYDKNEFYGDGMPYMPEDLHITADSLTWLPSGGSIEDGKARRMKYTYRPNGFYLDTGSGMGLKIISLSDRDMRIIRQQQAPDGKNAVTLYCVYRTERDVR